MPTEVEEIAKGLSEAQRNWLMSCEPRLGEQERPYTDGFLADCARPYLEVRPPEYERGVLIYPGDRIWLGGNGVQLGRRAWTELNELGLQVRAHLQRNEEQG